MRFWRTRPLWFRHESSYSIWQHLPTLLSILPEGRVLEPCLSLSSRRPRKSQQHTRRCDYSWRNAFSQENQSQERLRGTSLSHLRLCAGMWYGVLRRKGWLHFPFSRNAPPSEIEFKVNLLNPAAGERLVARGQVVKPGRTIMVCTGEVVAERADGSQQTIALMQATMMVVHDRPAISD